MYDVYLSKTEKGILFEEFIDNFLSICKSHQEQNRASAFAFIIYDFADANLRKVLMDPEYWDSLNKISGHYLTIFSLFDNHTKNKFNDILLPKKVKMKFEAHKVSVKKDLELSYREIINLFFGGAEFSSPSVLFFQVSDEKISDYFFVNLKEEEFGKGFLELKKIIEESIDPIKQITKENSEKYDRIFELLKENVKSAIWWKKTKAVTKKGINLISFASIFK